MSLTEAVLKGKRQVGVRNTTQENHVLHPGTLYRGPILVDGGYRVRTVGVGSGWFGYANILLAPRAWDDVDQAVHDHVQARDTGPTEDLGAL